MVDKGVPQGSLLINDLSHIYSIGKVHLYADDTVI